MSAISVAGSGALYDSNAAMFASAIPMARCFCSAFIRVPRYLVVPRP
jgi:hypothetical protein